MIEMLEGVPGSGKSYYAVSERLLKWVRAGRRVYVFVDGFYLDRLAMFEGTGQDVLENQITLWSTADEVRRGLLSVDAGSAVLIDEVQTVFRSKEKTDPELLRWLETHRHRGIDIVLMCQQYGQVTLGVNRLIEVTTKFRRLDRFGLKNRYQASVRGNPEELEVIRMFSGKYEPKLYAYYSSYSNAGVREARRGGSILRSPTLIIGLVGLLGSVAWFGTGKWLTPSADVLARQEKLSQSRQLPPVPLLPIEPTIPHHVETSPTEKVHITPIRIQGGIQSDVNGQLQWFYVSNTGRIMTDDDVARESGGIVNARMERGSRILYGSGVIWGGEGSSGELSRPSVQALLPVPHYGSAGTEERVPEATDAPVSAGGGVKEILATPPGILATPHF